MRRQRLYFAHPILAYGTEHETRALDHLVQLSPGWEIVNPATRYATGTAWLRSWPRLVRTLDALVVLAGPDGTVGTGVLREVADCTFEHVPVLVLDDSLHLRQLRGFAFLGPDARTAARAAWLLAGDRATLPPRGSTSHAA